MREIYVRKRKNRTRTVRILENMKRPTVIINSFTEEQTQLLEECLSAWTDINCRETTQKMAQAMLENCCAKGCAKGLARFTLFTNAKAKLVAQ